jgi:hypothetical protein
MALRARRSTAPKRGLGACPGFHANRAGLGDLAGADTRTEVRVPALVGPPLFEATKRLPKGRLTVPKHRVAALGVRLAGRG